MNFSASTSTGRLSEEAARFRLAVISGSSGDLFQKVSNPQQVIQQKQQERGSPFRSNSLQLPEQTNSPGNSGELRKRSCPNTSAQQQQQHPTIHEDSDHNQQDDDEVSAMATAIHRHDTAFRRCESMPATTTTGAATTTLSSSSSGRSRSSSSSNSKRSSVEPDAVGGGDFTQLQDERQLQQRKLLRKRMASDTDLWTSVGAQRREQDERYLRMASVAAAANVQV